MQPTTCCLKALQPGGGNGEQSQAQIEAFDDTWHWNESAEQAFDEVMSSGNSDAAEMLRAMRSFLKENDMMAYLAMMAVRLIELHRVLKSTGSLYLHCDPTASHYLKILLDAVFGKTNFKNEIVWKRSTPKGHAYSRLPTTHDIILSYDRGNKSTWNSLYSEYDQKYIKSHYNNIEPETGRHYQLDNTLNPNPNRPNLTYEWNGQTRVWRWTKEKMEALHNEGRLVYTSSGMPRYKRYLDEMPGAAITDFWDDIHPINSQAQERLGYPTQKPVALLERIISASSNEGDVVLDPFCGCGTTVHAAQKLHRRWIGIDVTHLAIGLIKRRLLEAFPGVSFDIVGVPQDLAGAQTLAEADKYEFQKWALAMIDATPYKGGKKGGDGGVDGYVYFKPDGKITEKAIVSVKGGQILTPAMVKDLIVTVDQEKAKMGIFLTLAPPTKGMVTQSAAAGFYKTEYGQFPKIQIVTIEQLFKPGNPIQMPWQDTSAFKKAKRETREKQNELDL